MKRVFLIGCVLSSRLVAAAPSAAQAEVLFREGKALLAAGKIGEACAAFDASERLDPTASTLLNQGNCHERNQQLATAWGMFLEAERRTRAATDDSSRELHALAAERAAKLEPRLSTLTIRIPDNASVGGLEIVRDSEVIDPALWNKTLPIDGGTYKITAHAPGNNEWTTTVTVASERDAKSIEVPTLKALHVGGTETLPPARPLDAAAPTSVPVAAAPAVASTSVDAAVTSSSGQRDDAPHAPRLPVYVGVASAAVVGLAVTLEVVASSTYNTSKTDSDPSTQASQWHTANHERIAGDALAVAGVAGVGAAVWLFVRSRREPGAIAVAPSVSEGHVGLTMQGAF